MNGSHLAASSYASEIYLFESDSDTPLWSYYTGWSLFEREADHLAISADGEYVVAGAGISSVYLFEAVSSASVTPEPMPLFVVASLVLGVAFATGAGITVIIYPKLKRRSPHADK